jgi:hypothetical protein
MKPQVIEHERTRMQSLTDAMTVRPERDACGEPCLIGMYVMRQRRNYPNENREVQNGARASSAQGRRAGRQAVPAQTVSGCDKFVERIVERRRGCLMLR